MQCDANTLSKLSSCFRCLTDGQLLPVKTYLLCQIANTGIAGNARITEAGETRITESGDTRVIE